MIVGGHSDVVARRAGRLGDGFFPGKGDDDRLRELIAIMRASAEEAGRDPDAIEITTGGAAAFARTPSRRSASSPSWACPGWSSRRSASTRPQMSDVLAEFGENVIAKVNA